MKSNGPTPRNLRPPVPPRPPMTGYLQSTGPSKEIFSVYEMPGLKSWDPVTGVLVAKGTGNATLMWDRSNWVEIPPPPGKPHGPVPAPQAPDAETVPEVDPDEEVAPAFGR